MKDAITGGIISFFVIFGHLISWIGSGILAWNWVDPDSFGRAILFVIAWGILGSIIDFILIAIMMGIGSLLDS